MSLRPLLWTALLTAHGAVAGQADPAPPTCSAPEHRQFDFWIGDWEVRMANGKHAGRNTITVVAGGCALHEHWVGRGGFTGQSLNGWNRHTRRWQQTWLDSSGGRLDLVGEAEGGGMRLEGQAPDDSEPHRVVAHRIRWTPLPDGRVRQLWESSADEGRTWSVAFDGYYRRRQGPVRRP